MSILQFFNNISGLIGVIVILGLAFLMSNNRKKINFRLVLSGLALQIILAFIILVVPVGKEIFGWIGTAVTKILDYSMAGGRFVFGIFADEASMEQVFGHGNSFVFILTLIPAIIFVCVLVSMAYHVGLMQRFVAVIAKGMNWVMRVSGAEALSNVSSAFLGQVEAQIVIKPYLSSMTMSELLASMSGSMACIAGGVMAVYISLGVPASYLIAASLMAAPGALVISKIIYPETQESLTKGKIKLEIKRVHSNLLDAISHGAADGMKVSMNVIAMLIGFIALIAMIDGILGFSGRHLYSWTGWDWSIAGLDLQNLNLRSIIGIVFSVFAYIMGVPWHEAHAVGSLMGTKFVINEFVAYIDFRTIKETLSPKSIAIASVALCGFANFSSIAIQVGGIGALAPDRRKDLAKLGFTALLCGTMTNYISAALTGVILSF